MQGVVTYAKPSAKVKGRAGVTVRFRSVSIGSRTYDISAEPLRREAEGTKAKDARNIGIGAGAGAVIGGIIGGGKGAGIGAAVGGGAGTAKVLATKGAEVRLPSGTIVTTRLDSPLVVEMPRAVRGDRNFSSAMRPRPSPGEHLRQAEMFEFVLQYAIHAGWPKASVAQGAVFEQGDNVANGLPFTVKGQAL